MKSTIQVLMRAPWERIFPLAAEVERWPQILPHYRYVRRVPDPDGERRFAMGARRGAIPVTWEAVQRPLREERTIEFVHTGGVTKGMWVAWRFVPVDGGTEVQHRAPAPARMAVHRGLRGAARHRAAVHRGHRWAHPAPHPDACRGSGPMTPRRVVITGIGAITPIGIGADGLWDGVMADRSAVRTIDRFDASPFPVAHRRPGGRLRSGRPSRPAARAAPRPLQRALGRCLAHGVRGRGSRRERGRCHHRRLDRLRPRRRRLRRGAACRLRGARRTRRGSHARAGRLRRGRREQRGARPGPDRSDRRQRQLLRLGCGGDRPGVRGHPRRDGRRRAGGWGGGAAGAAHLRRLRHDPRPVAAERRAIPRLSPIRSGPRRLRDGRGCRGARARGTRMRPQARRADRCRDRRVRRQQRCVPHDRTAAGRTRRRARDPSRPGRCANGAGSRSAT